ncbi:hypothetical protein CHO01_36980 [Cellulomonas hominis]|uniref:Uncharacterized protein n=1 Tax=Cellulomonas hominis TaxID=156981 RepID=A0A511FHA9_9CELL|nr:hypothetical protein [Cellulomonas hominis]MBB5474716.1 hypothetical protein [Cellulomonas hominis]NKY05981.1 hypothetical protein [Cellulomonas hominis]GEL48582.1 hypothetical protein CHO01_36980 [Cellulomonas hominis]
MKTLATGTTIALSLPATAPGATEAEIVTHLYDVPVEVLADVLEQLETYRRPL